MKLSENRSKFVDDMPLHELRKYATWLLTDYATLSNIPKQNIVRKAVKAGEYGHALSLTKSRLGHHRETLACIVQGEETFTIRTEQKTVKFYEHLVYVLEDLVAEDKAVGEYAIRYNAIAAQHERLMSSLEGMHPDSTAAENVNKQLDRLEAQAKAFEWWQ